ncbi:MAG TPA: sialidase family protein [Methylobacter sp.]|jgi:hypothetical protein
MIDLPNLLTKRAVHSHSGASEKGFFGRRLWIQLLLISSLALSACSQINQDHLKAGGADYRHYPTGGGLFVTAAFGPDGRLWRIVPEKHHVYVDYSTDLGNTFSAPVPINTEEQHIKISGENRPGIAVDHAGRVYVIYTAESNQPATVYFSSSGDNGRSFSAPTPLGDKTPVANSFQGRLALSPSGQAYAFWHDERNRTDWKQPGNAIYYATIDNRGNPAPARQLSDTLCDCCRIAVAFDNNNSPVLLARFVYPGGIRDHGLIKLQADGQKTQETRATFDQWAIEACPDHGPAIAISDNTYHIAWFTQGSVRQGLFYAYSSDQGQHFSNPLSFGYVGKLPSHPDIIAKSNHITLAWTEFDGNKTQLLIMQSHDGGQSWLPAKAVAETTDKADFPFLLSKNEEVYVSWNSKNEGYRLIPVN